MSGLKPRPLLSLSVSLIAVLIFPQFIAAQSSDRQDFVESPIESQTYGTTALTYVSLSPFDFVPIESTMTYAFNDPSPRGIFRTSTTGSGFMVADLKLPAGAAISVVEWDVCDNSTTERFVDFLQATSHVGVMNSNLSSFVTNDAESPGCVTRNHVINPVLVVNNAVNSYLLALQYQGSGIDLILVSARVGYRLQVSPPPGVATFVDVPTNHPFFRFIEALVRAGITSGCGSGNYCPNSPITRGEMAVFLSAALGLHWAP